MFQQAIDLSWSGFRFYHLLGLGFECWFSFLKPCSVIWIWSAWVPPSGQWSMCQFSSQNLWYVSMNQIYARAVQRGAWTFINHFINFAFLHTSLSAISLVLFNTARSSFSVPSPGRRVFSYPTCHVFPWLFRAKWWKDQEKNDKLTPSSVIFLSSGHPESAHDSYFSESSNIFFKYCTCVLQLFSVSETVDVCLLHLSYHQNQPISSVMT